MAEKPFFGQLCIKVYELRAEFKIMVPFGVAAVGLRFDQHGTNEISMQLHSKTYHVYCLLNVGLTVVALLTVINLVYNNDTQLLLAVVGNALGTENIIPIFCIYL